MKFPALDYIQWAKSQPRVAINLARSGVDACPPSLLKLTRSDIVTTLPVKYGYQPLLEAIGQRYDVRADRVFTVSGGTSFANYVACAAALDGAPARSEVLVERPTYEPLLRIPQAFGHAARRFERRFEDSYAIDIDGFARSINRHTRLAIVTNLHNPSGARIPFSVMKEMARLMARVSGYLLVDEVYLECLFRDDARSCVHAGANVLVTNSLTKAYGLDGLRAGWILGPRDLIARAGRINDVMTNNGVAPGERMAFAAFRHLRSIDTRAHARLDGNLEIARRFFAAERRLKVMLPEGGNVLFPRLPRGIDSDEFAGRLLRNYSTLVVPGRFFETQRHIRISFGCKPSLLRQGLENISRALDACGAHR
jgi:aspartate/methionine/tyrosine aminotransferase